MKKWLRVVLGLICMGQSIFAMKEEQVCSFASLPSEIKLKIMTYLSATDLGRCALTSKDLYELVQYKREQRKKIEKLINSSRPIIHYPYPSGILFMMMGFLS
jgi:hypothetical protein